MHQTKHPVTGVEVVDDDAEGVYIHHFGKRELLLPHLLEDTVEVFFTPIHKSVDTLPPKPAPNRLFDVLQHLLAVTAGASHRLFQRPITHRPVGCKAEFFKLCAKIVNTETVGNGDVDIQSLQGNTTTLLRRHHTQCPHIVQSIRQLYQDDPDILGHRQNHLAKTGRLGFGFGAEVDLAQLTHTIHQIGDLLVELLGHLLLAHLGILDNIMEDCRHQTLMVDAHICKNPGHRQRVKYVGLTTFALLALMGSALKR